MAIIYKIQNNLNGKTYVGQTRRTLKKRLDEHIKDKKSIVSRAINKYGLHNFTITEVCSVLKIKNLNLMEEYFISYFNSVAPYGYNKVGYCNTKLIVSESTKRKVSQSKKGIKRSEQLKQKLKTFYKNNYHPSSKAILQYDFSGNFIKEFGSTKEADSFGFCHQNIWRCCAGKKLSHKKFFWFYKENFDYSKLQYLVKRYKYQGINFHKNVKKFTLTIKNKYLGCYETKEQALEAKEAYYGKS